MFINSGKTLSSRFSPNILLHNYPIMRLNPRAQENDLVGLLSVGKPPSHSVFLMPASTGV